MYKGKNKTALMSQKCIKEAFFALLKEKNFQDITISDLCKKADISRQTFYSLFKNKENILIYELKHTYPFAMCQYNEDVTLQKLCTSFSSYLNENYCFIKLLIDNDYGQLLYQMFYQSLLHCHCDMRDEAAIKDEYFASFMAGGMLSITKTYVTKEKREQSFIEKITYELFSGTFFK